MIAYSVMGSGGFGTLGHPGAIELIHPSGDSDPQVIIGNAFNPAWSPDGQRIAYVSPGDLSDRSWNQIGVANSDGSHQQVLVSDPTYTPSARGPVFSPDGRSIAFIAQDSGDWDSGSSIWITSSTSPNTKHRVLDMPNQNIDRLAWSPDGTQLAFVTNPVWAPFSGTYGVFVTPSSGGSYREIDDENHSGGYLLTNSIDWGPQGILYMKQSNVMTSQQPVGAGHIAYTVPPTLGYALAPYQRTGQLPEWAGIDWNHNLMLFFPGSTPYLQLTFGQGGIGDVAWQPVPQCPSGYRPLGHLCVRDIHIPWIGRNSSSVDWLSREVQMIVGCPAGQAGCQLGMGAFSGGTQLGSGFVKLQAGHSRNVAIRFSLKGRSLLRAGAVRRIDVVMRARKGRVLARRTGLLVRRASSLSATCPSSPTVGEVTLSGRLSVPGGGPRWVFVEALADLGTVRALRVRTGRDGRFSTAIEVSQTGFWNLKVMWPGSSSVVPAFAGCDLRVAPPASPVRASLTLTCPASAVAGSPVNLAGSVRPALIGVSVKISYRESADTIVDTVYTNSSGQFSDSRTFNRPTQLQIHAALGGSFEYQAAESAPCSMTITAPPPAATSLTLACPPAGQVGQPINESGTLTGAPADATVTVIYTAPDGTTITHSLTTTGAGGFSDSITPTDGGSWSAQVFYAGDVTHAGSSSHPCATAVKSASALSLICPAKAALNSPFTVNGTLTPPEAGAQITILYTPPKGSGQSNIVAPDHSGAFSDQFTPTTTGNWHAQAFFAGDATLLPSNSSACTIMVS